MASQQQTPSENDQRAAGTENLGSLQCNICSKVYSTKTYDSYKKHVAKCSQETQYQCNFCQKYFVSEASFKKHVRQLHTRGKTFKCKLCEKSFTSSFTRSEHEKTHIEKESRQKDRLKCEKCDRSFLWKSSLNRHLQTHFTDGLVAYICDCGVGFSQYTKLYTHKKECRIGRKKKGSKKSNESQEKRAEKLPQTVITEKAGTCTDHKCQFCDRRFTYREMLNEHIESCDQFSKIFEVTRSFKENLVNKESNSKDSLPMIDNEKENVVNISESDPLVTETLANMTEMRANNSLKSGLRETLRRQIKTPKRFLDNIDHDAVKHKREVSVVSKYKKQKLDVDKTKVILNDNGNVRDNDAQHSHDDERNDGKTATQLENGHAIDKEGIVETNNKIILTGQSLDPLLGTVVAGQSEDGISGAIRAEQLQDNITGTTGAGQSSSMEVIITDTIQSCTEIKDIGDTDIQTEAPLVKGKPKKTGVQSAQRNNSKCNPSKLCRYKCTTKECGKIFLKLSSLIDHKESVHIEKLMRQCLECARTFTSNSVYKSHLRMKHSKLCIARLGYKNVELCRPSSEGTTVSTSVWICVMCGVTLHAEGDYEDHSVKCRPRQLRFYCPYCDRNCETFAAIQEHIGEAHPGEVRTVVPSQKYQSMKSKEREPALQVVDGDTACTLCQQEFTTSNLLRQHMNDKHATFPYCCGVCRGLYGRPTALKKHLLSHAISLACQYCGKVFYDKTYLQRHINMHTGERPYQCDICGKSYCAENSVKKHMRQHHLDIYKDRYEDTRAIQHMVEAGQSVCHLCGVSCSSVKQLETHIKQHGDNFTLQCDTCSKKFQTKQELSLHQMKHLFHKVKTGNQTVVDVNGLDQQGRTRLFQDMRVVDPILHPTGKRLKCSLCGQRFKKTNALNQHIHTVHLTDSDKKYICHVCHRGFLRKSLLISHMRVHTNNRPYRCRICKKTFKQLAHVREHLRIHGKCQFVCQICGGEFKTRATLGNHAAIHCNIFPFKCPLENCSQVFRDIPSLLSHLAKENTDDKDLLCNRCTISFHVQAEYISHMQRHTKEELFNCGICGVSFFTYKGLYFHQAALGHIEKSEVQSINHKPHNKTKNNVMKEISQDVELDILLSQYDYIGVDGKIAERPLKSLLNECPLSDEEDNSGGETAEDDELILIAKQLTHMAAGTEQLKELVIPETSVNHLPDLVQIVASTAEACTSDNELYKTNTASDNIGYPAVVVQAESKADVLQYTDGFSEEVSGEMSIPTLNFVIKESQPMNSIDIVPSEDADPNNVDYIVREGVPSLETFTEPAIEALEPSEDVVHKTVEYIIDDTEKTSNAESQEEMNIVSADITPGVKVLDQQGNEVIICVVNEDGEQERVADGNEVIRTVLGTGKYDIEKQYQEISTQPNSVEDTENNDGKFGSLMFTDVYVIRDKLEDPIKTSTAYNARTGIGPGYKTPKKKTKVALDDNTDKLQGKLDTSLEPESNVKVQMHYYKNKSDAELYPYQCNKCSLRFELIKNLNHHKKTHLSQSERKYRCSLCPAGFNIPSALAVHVRTHSGERPFACTKCDKAFKQRGHLLTHLRVHEGYFPFQCVHCDKRFIANNILKKHIQQKHGNASQVADPSETTCDLCGLVFSDLKAFRSHKVNHLDKRTQKKLVRKYNAALATNQDTVQDDESSGDDTDTIKKEIKKESFICDICGLIFNQAYSLKHHMMRHETGSDSMCIQCNKTFGNKFLLTRHMKSHSNSAVQCEVCGKQLKYEASLKKHMQQHEGAKKPKYQCSKCETGYMLEPMFLKHIASCFEDIFKDNNTSETMAN